MKSAAGLVVAAWVCVSGCATSAKPAAEEPARAAPAPLDPQAVSERVDALLSASERAASDDEWQRLGPEGLSALERIYADPGSPLSRRARAVSAMGQIGTVPAQARLQAIVADEKAPLRTTAVLALGRCAPERAVPQIAPLLESGDPLLRDAAAQALGRVSTPEARRALEDQLGKEQDPRVREAIQHSLTQQVP